MTTNSNAGSSPVDRRVMRFELRHKIFKGEPQTFSEEDAPDWLTSVKTIPGSTMDNRWFWRDHVLTLEIGASVDTDFNTVTRIS